MCMHMHRVGGAARGEGRRCRRGHPYSEPRRRRHAPVSRKHSSGFRSSLSASLSRPPLLGPHIPSIWPSTSRSETSACGPPCSWRRRDDVVESGDAHVAVAPLVHQHERPAALQRLAHLPTAQRREETPFPWRPLLCLCAPRSRAPPPGLPEQRWSCSGRARKRTWSAPARGRVRCCSNLGCNLNIG